MVQNWQNSKLGKVAFKRINECCEEEKQEIQTTFEPRISRIAGPIPFKFDT